MMIKYIQLNCITNLLIIIKYIKLNDQNTGITLVNNDNSLSANCLNNICFSRAEDYCIDS